jgi:hypothetical protein
MLRSIQRLSVWRLLQGPPYHATDIIIASVMEGIHTMSPTTLISSTAIFVSLAVFVVQYLQWRTANQKVVVDLYDRRLKVFTQLEKAIGSVLRQGDARGDAFNDFLIGEADSRFLFGDDVRTYLMGLRKTFAWMSTYTGSVIDQYPDEERGTLIHQRANHLSEIAAFYDKAPDLFAPYMKLTQKNIPFWRPW